MNEMRIDIAVLMNIVLFTTSSKLFKLIIGHVIKLEIHAMTLETFQFKFDTFHKNVKDDCKKSVFTALLMHTIKFAFTVSILLINFISWYITYTCSSIFF